jgi:hypothetical protein
MVDIVFLDIDGVLNCLGRDAVKQQGHHRDYRNWNQWSLEALSMFEADIVISSSWRILNEPDWFTEQFALAGFPNLVAIDLTTKHGGGFRGAQVADWMVDVNRSYVIIDDESDFYHYQPRIKTDYRTGLIRQDYIDFITEGPKLLYCMEEF